MRTNDHFKTLCCLGLPPQAAMVAIAGALHDVIPSEWNKIGYLTEGPGVGAGYAEHPDCVVLAAKHAGLFRADPWFAGFFGSLLDRHGTTGWLGLRERSGYQNCAVFDILERPLDSHWVLDATFHDDRRTFAGLMMTRPRGMKPFGPDDAARLESLRPWITHALRDRDDASSGGGLLAHPSTKRTSVQKGIRPAESIALPADAERPGSPRFGHAPLSTPALMRGTAIVDLDARLLHRSAGVGYLFALLEGMSTAIEPARRVTSDAVPSPVKRVIRRLVGTAKTSRGAPPRLQIPTDWGLVTVEASWLAPPGIDVIAFAGDPRDGHIAVNLELRETPAAHAARVLRASGATPTQVRVGVLLALGKQKPEIATLLGVRPTSIEDATRKLYLRMQVHTVAELCALLWLSEADHASRFA